MAEKRRILLVDDDADFVEAAKLVLEDAGLQVDTASDGAECLDQVRTHPPDLIVLDVIMATELEGFRISHELRINEETAHIPVVMVSAVYAQQPDLPPPEELGLQVAAFLSKPVGPERLLDVVREHLPR